MTYHVCVWIDGTEARVFQLNAHELVHRKVIETKGAERRPGQDETAVNEPFLHAVANELVAASAILIAGPGTTKTVLHHFLQTRRPDVAEHVWDVKPMDYLSEPQIVAEAQHYFRLADRVH